MAPVGTIVKLTEYVVGGAFRVVRGAASVVTGAGRPDGSESGHEAPSGEWVPPRPGEKLAAGRDVPPAPAPRPGEQVTDESVETSVGTTGAGRGVNPATGRPDPHPANGPGLDPSLTKAVKKEAERMHRASEPKKR